jgi:hypothetical protein
MIPHTYVTTRQQNKTSAPLNHPLSKQVSSNHRPPCRQPTAADEDELSKCDNHPDLPLSMNLSQIETSGTQPLKFQTKHQLGPSFDQRDSIADVVTSQMIEHHHQLHDDIEDLLRPTSRGLHQNFSYQNLDRVSATSARKQVQEAFIDPERPASTEGYISNSVGDLAAGPEKKYFPSSSALKGAVKPVMSPNLPSGRESNQPQASIQIMYINQRIKVRLAAGESLQELIDKVSI